MASRDEYVQWAYLAGLIGGVLMIAAGIVGLLFVVFVGGVFSFAVGAGGDRMALLPFAFFLIALVFAVAVPLAAGAVSIHAARRVRAASPERPEGAARHPFETWGLVLIVAGVGSFLGGGGFALGGIAAIVGGFFALQAARTAPAGQSPSVSSQGP